LKSKKLFFLYFFFIFLSFNLFSQFTKPHLQRDDFERLRDWWTLHNEGFGGNPQVLPAVNSGYMQFILEDPAIVGIGNSWVEDGANASIETASVNQLYLGSDSLIIRQRIKMETPHQAGSRGWGLWYNEYPTITQSEVVWFMQQKEEDGHPWTEDETWWRVTQANGRNFSANYFNDLSNDYLTGWHVYDIYKYGLDRIEYYIDGILVLETNDNIPELSHEYNLWIDNVVYHIIPSGSNGFEIEILLHEWIGQNIVICDYIEIISGSNPIGHSISPNGILKLREYPNEIAFGYDDYLWKNYSFNTNGGKTVIIATAKAEEYDGYDNPDQMKLVIDDVNDYGYTGSYGWNGNVLQTSSKTVVIDTVLNSGNHNIKVYSKVTPILYDVTVLNATSGDIQLNASVNETAPSGSNNTLWKSYNFNCASGDEVAIYISASADENDGWAHRGPGVSSRNIFDENDDDLRIAIYQNDTLIEDYGWFTEESWYGNELFGETKSVLLHEILAGGTYELRFYANNTPTLNKIIVFAENNDNSLSVGLSSFTARITTEGVLLEWKTESEVENLGFNIYRYSCSDTLTPLINNFIQINTEIVKGAGNSSTENTYKYLNVDIFQQKRYWYLLEDISYNGERTKHKPILVVFPDNKLKSFELNQNYPNPFNSVTTIPFILNDNQEITIDIFNLNGKLIKQLLNGEIEAGSHTISWNSTDMENLHVSSGVYYYRFKTKYQTIVKKMLLLR